MWCKGTDVWIQVKGQRTAVTLDAAAATSNSRLHYQITAAAEDKTAAAPQQQLAAHLNQQKVPVIIPQPYAQVWQTPAQFQQQPHCPPLVLHMVPVAQCGPQAWLLLLLLGGALACESKCKRHSARGMEQGAWQHAGVVSRAVGGADCTTHRLKGCSIVLHHLLLLRHMQRVLWCCACVFKCRYVALP